MRHVHGAANSSRNWDSVFSEFHVCAWEWCRFRFFFLVPEVRKPIYGQLNCPESLSMLGPRKPRNSCRASLLAPSRPLELVRDDCITFCGSRLSGEVECCSENERTNSPHGNRSHERRLGGAFSPLHYLAPDNVKDFTAKR